MNNFVQYLLIIIMIHFILKRILLDLEGIKKDQVKVKNIQEGSEENFSNQTYELDEEDEDTFNAEYFNNLKNLSNTENSDTDDSDTDDSDNNDSDVENSEDESDFEDIKNELLEDSDDDDESDEEDVLEIENKLRHQQLRNNIRGYNERDNIFRENNFSGDNLNLESNLKMPETNNFISQFNLEVNTSSNFGQKKINVVENGSIQYKDESIMNGGSFMDNIVGFDNDSNMYATLE